MRSGSWSTDSSCSPLFVNLPHIFEWVLFHNPLQGAVIPIACTLFSTTSFPSLSFYTLLYTLYKCHFLNRICEINQLFDDILIIWPAPVYTVYIYIYEWMMRLYSSLLCIVVHPKHFTIMWGVSPQPPPVCSIHLDDVTAATGQRRLGAHHTPATGGEERESLSQSSVCSHHTPATGGEDRES